MRASNKFVDKEDQLDHIADMLTMLSNMLAATEFALLKHFVDLAAAQAREDRRAIAERPHGPSATWSGTRLN
jgi:hypothetical protein